MQVSVRDNNVEQALRALKKKLQREGVFREMKLKQHFEKPSVKKAREQAEAVRRAITTGKDAVTEDGRYRITNSKRGAAPTTEQERQDA